MQPSVDSETNPINAGKMRVQPRFHKNKTGPAAACWCRLQKIAHPRFRSRRSAQPQP